MMESLTTAEWPPVDEVRGLAARSSLAPRTVERWRGRRAVVTFVVATLSLAAGNLLEGCASDAASCVTNGTVQVCAKSVSEGVSVTIHGLSTFSTGRITVPAENVEMPIAAAADGKLPDEVSNILEVPSGSTVTVKVSDGVSSVEISVKASS